MIAPNTEIMREIEKRQFDLGLGLLKVYNYYRVFVGLALLVVFSQGLMGSRLGYLDPELFGWVGLGYCLINLLTTLLVQVIPQRVFRAQIIGFGLVTGDIFALTWMTYLSGGVASGLGLLVLVAVVAGAILVTGRATTLLAAVASIATLYSEFYLSLTAPDLHDDYFQAGVLGIFYFAFSIVIHFISKQLRDSDVHALTQAAELTDLEHVNRLIIQRMRTGIILVNENNSVRMANQSARRLVGAREDDELLTLPDKLGDQLAAWRSDTSLRTTPFQIRSDTPEIRVNFSPVRSNGEHGDVTIFLEDTGEIQQQAQQLKLAALGRLSASIAHEIRNPLGAISHAAQLLSESQNLDKGDQRLTDIIHSHGQRMNGVIENVLEMSRRAPPAPVRLSLADFLKDFANDFKEAVGEAEIEITVDPSDTEIRVDESQLRQALTNLASNAIRHSREHSGEPWVLLQGGLDGPTDRPYVNIIDHGAGVPEAARKDLFEPFFTTERLGTGLGLYISRELCEANQAQLTYLDHADGGACFRISFAHPDRITGKTGRIQ